MTAAAATDGRAFLLAAEDVVAGYDRLQVLHGLTIGVRPGSVIGVLGPNGAGKSTLLHTLAGLVPASSGRVVFDGDDVTRRPAELRAEAGIAYVPEGRTGLLRSLTVAETLSLAARTTRRSTAQDRENPWPMIGELFPRLAERRTQVAGSLSGGEQQMLAIAAVLLRRPRVLLLDEPSLGLAPVIVDDLYDKLRELHLGEGMTMIVVEEKAERVLELAEYVYVVQHGDVTHEGPPESLDEAGGLAGVVFGDGGDADG